jgi:hypothetical protein
MKNLCVPVIVFVSRSFKNMTKSPSAGMLKKAHQKAHHVVWRESTRRSMLTIRKLQGKIH